MSIHNVVEVKAQKKIEYAIHKHMVEKGHESFILYAIGNDAKWVLINAWAA